MVEHLRPTRSSYSCLSLIVFCYTAQIHENSVNESCHAKDGNPFGPYWNHFQIDFDGDIFYKPLFFDIINPDAWNAK